MTAQQFRDAGKQLLNANRYADAVHPLRTAAQLAPEDETAWQDLVLAASWADQHIEAIDFCKQALRHHARSDWLWRQLGSELISVDRLDKCAGPQNLDREMAVA